MMGVKAVCKNCKREVLADSFKLHHTLRMMVCPDCYTGKTKRQEEMKKQEIPKPPGWDAEDEYLLRARVMRKQQTQAQFSKIPGSQQVKCTCHNCQYVFKFDPYKKIPYSCPYCNTEVPRVKTFDL